MEPPKKYRFEVCNAEKSSEWESLFEISEEELLASEELRDELNKINSPVMLRIRIVDSREPRS
jgi:hypothetical protein